MPSRAPAPKSYVSRLLDELEAIENEFVEILQLSTIRYTNPNRRDSSVIFVGAADYGWAPSDDSLSQRRMSTVGRLRSWEPRYRLLFPHATPEVQKVLDRRLGHLESWLVRGNTSEHSIPGEIPAAVEIMRKDVKALASLADMLPADQWDFRVVVDTNTLIDNPNPAAYSGALPGGYLVHLIPVVLRELDDLKRSGRTPELRDAAARANRRLKGIRANAAAAAEVRVEGKVFLVFDYLEPKADALPEWLDLSVPDDRFVASTLLIQSAHPGSSVYAATSDINLQTKLHAVGLPFLEPEDPTDS